MIIFKKYLVYHIKIFMWIHYTVMYIAQAITLKTIAYTTHAHALQNYNIII